MENEVDMKKVMFQINHNFALMNIVGFDLNHQEQELADELTKMILGSAEDDNKAVGDETKKKEENEPSKNTTVKQKRSRLSRSPYGTPYLPVFKEEQLIKKHMKFSKQSLFICSYCYHRTLFGCVGEIKRHMKVCDERDGSTLEPYLVKSVKKFINFPKLK